VPMVVDHARRDVYGDETHLWTLLRFAEDGGQAMVARDARRAVQPHEQLALAGFLAGYSGLTRDAYTLETASCPCSLGLEDHGERVD
jgi:hypothetical protein